MINTFFLVTNIFSNCSELQSTKTLKQYKQFLVDGTYGGQDWSCFDIIPKSRYDTFKVAFEHFENNNGKVVVELGTTRSFVHGGLKGCNSDDQKYWTPDQPKNWDWGAGAFTLMATKCLKHLNPAIHTVDIAAKHIQRCKIMTSDSKKNIQYHVCLSVNFLKQCEPRSIDLLYVDTGDITPVEHTARIQLEEAKIIIERDLISPHGIILIDDVRNQTPKKFGDTSELGKAKYSIPYFLEHGFKLLANEYQVILQKI